MVQNGLGEAEEEDITQGLNRVSLRMGKGEESMEGETNWSA